jgi:hypothetical protein
MDPSKAEDHFPLWMALISAGVAYALMMAFEKVSKNEIDRPGEEVPMPGVTYTNNPFENDTQTFDQQPQH